MIACLLGHSSTTKANVTSALRAYEAIRLPRTHDVMLGSRQNGLNFEFNGEYGDDLKGIPKSIKEVTRWISELDPEEDAQAALKKMEEFNS